MTRHRSTPWEYRSAVQAGPWKGGHYIFRDEAVSAFAYARDERDAAFIVKAVNTHDALMKALEDIITADTVVSDDGKVHDHGPSAWIAIKALAAAVGTPGK